MTFGMLIANNIMQKKLDEAKKSTTNNGSLSGATSEELTIFEKSNNLEPEDIEQLKKDVAALNEAQADENILVRIYPTKVDGKDCTKKTTIIDGKTHSKFYYYNEKGAISKEVLTIDGEQKHCIEYNYDKAGNLSSVVGTGDAIYGRVGTESYSNYQTNGETASWTVTNGSAVEQFTKKGNTLTSTKTENGVTINTTTELDNKGNIIRKTIESSNGDKEVHTNYKYTGLKTSYSITVTNSAGEKMVGSGKEYFYGVKSEKKDIKVTAGSNLEKFINQINASAVDILDDLLKTVEEIETVYEYAEKSSDEHQEKTIQRYYDEMKACYDKAKEAKTLLKNYDTEEKIQELSKDDKKKRSIKEKISELKAALKEAKELEEKIKKAEEEIKAKEKEEEEKAKNEQDETQKTEQEKWDKLLEAINGVSKSIKDDLKDAINDIVKNDGNLMKALNEIAKKDGEIATKLQELIKKVAANNPNDALGKIKDELNKILGKMK